MLEAWNKEKAELESKVAATEAKKMDTLRVLQGVRAKQKTSKRDLQRIRGTPSIGMSSHPFS